jgi:hypothetical protein
VLSLWHAFEVHREGLLFSLLKKVGRMSGDSRQSFDLDLFETKSSHKKVTGCRSTTDGFDLNILKQTNLLNQKKHNLKIKSP